MDYRKLGSNNKKKGKIAVGFIKLHNIYFSFLFLSISKLLIITRALRTA
jgi:hypothetical protein